MKKCENCRHWDRLSFKIEGRHRCIVGSFLSLPEDTCEYWQEMILELKQEERSDETD